MSWIQKLHETYEHSQSMIGKVALEKEVPLLPICHTTQKAHIEIVIDHQGNFKRARIVPKNNARTIIPCTESSGGRTSGGAPHPLCDKLQYVANDYSKFGGEKESSFKLEPSDYIKNDFNGEHFRSECTNNQYHLIKEMLALRKKRLTAYELFNELIKIPNLTDIINNNGGIANIQTGISDTTTRVINKYKLLEIFPLTLEKTVTYEYLLEHWCNSGVATPKTRAVLEYVRRGCVVKDLVEKSVLFVGSDGKLIKKRDGKKQNKNVIDIFDLLPGRVNRKGEIENWQADAFIRWEVEIPDDKCPKVWEDTLLWDSWINYYSNIKQEKSFCYVTGVKLVGAEQHPAKLRTDGDKAKLISSNDASGFTFRGRFTDAGQACGVGFTVSQKAHGALRWLISRQGKVFFVKGDGRRKEPGLTIVAWATSGKPVPRVTDDSLSILGFDDLPEDEPLIVSTAQDVANRFKNRMLGYASELGNTDNIIVMGMDSASKGRLAITYFREDLTASDFLQRIENWHKTCEWIHEYRYKDIQDKATGKIVRLYQPFIGAPAPSNIAEAAYGSNVDDKLKKTTVARLLLCILDGQQIPRDIVDSAVRRACKQTGMERWEWNKTFSIACALYRKVNEKEDYSMALDKDRKSRDYLYGRLLAAADCLERFALVTSEKKRDTNAARLMQRFADRPCSTWKTIELSLVPYKARLGGRSKKFLDAIGETMNLFDPPEDFTSDKPLSGEFLLGYHCQRQDLKPKKDEPQSIENDNLTEE